MNMIEKTEKILKIGYLDGIANILRKMYDRKVFTSSGQVFYKYRQIKVYLNNSARSDGLG